jgi:hypothetical protein
VATLISNSSGASGPPPIPPHKAVAGFDSATGMLGALANFLHGHDFPLLGQLPGRFEPAVERLLRIVNRLPRRPAGRPRWRTR